MKNPYNDYNDMAQETLSGRDLEAHVLTKAANKLKSCKSSWDQPNHNDLLNEALKYNQKVWTFFQSELSTNDNGLSKEVRQDLLNLSIFIDRHTLNVMSFPDPDKLNVLIDINMNIASGLREITA